jgi:hypothetical protein
MVRQRSLAVTAGLIPPSRVDYDTYGEGEALLGWLNATVQLERDAASLIRRSCSKALAAAVPIAPRARRRLLILR